MALSLKEALKQLFTNGRKISHRSWKLSRYVCCDYTGQLRHHDNSKCDLFTVLTNLLFENESLDDWEIYQEKITDINVGDVFVHPKGDVSPSLIIQFKYQKPETERVYSYVGYYGLEPYSNTIRIYAFTKQELIDELNRKGMVFARNINKEIKKLIDESKNND